MGSKRRTPSPHAVISGLCLGFLGVVLGLSPPAQASPFFIDQFTVVKNGTTLFTDPFDNGIPPPNAPNFTGGGPASYFVSGTLNESSGKVRLDTLGAAVTTPPVPAAFGGAQNIFIELAQLNTNIDPGNLTLGLKSNATFSVTGVFDLALPTANYEVYGIRLFDPVGPTSFNDLLPLVVRRGGDGLVRIEFNRIDASLGVFTQIDNVLLDPAHDQIALTLTRADVGNNAITASFRYLDGGVPGPVTTFATTGNIFNGENFTTAAFFFASPVPVPEPTTLLLLGSGLAGLGAWRRMGRS